MGVLSTFYESFHRMCASQSNAKLLKETLHIWTIEACDPRQTSRLCTPDGQIWMAFHEASKPFWSCHSQPMTRVVYTNCPLSTGMLSSWPKQQVNSKHGIPHELCKTPWGSQWKTSHRCCLKILSQEFHLSLTEDSMTTTVACMGTLSWSLFN